MPRAEAGNQRLAQGHITWLCLYSKVAWDPLAPSCHMGARITVTTDYFSCGTQAEGTAAGHCMGTADSQEQICSQAVATPRPHCVPCGTRPRDPCPKHLLAVESHVGTMHFRQSPFSQAGRDGDVVTKGVLSSAQPLLPEPGDKVCAVHVLSPHTGLSTDHQGLLLGRTCGLRQCGLPFSPPPNMVPTPQCLTLTPHCPPAQSGTASFTCKGQGLHRVEVLPVGAVRNAVQIPGGGEEGPEASLSNQL